jgi:hypothetical protein
VEWSQNGGDIFCGFELGRLVQFNVRFKDGVMKHVPLYPDNYDSGVVQLSSSGSMLLVSTIDRAFLLDIGTNKLVQVRMCIVRMCGVCYVLLSVIGWKEGAEVWNIWWLLCC